MIFNTTKFKEAYIIDVKKIEDERGFFGRSYCKKEFEHYELNTNLVQINISHNYRKGTLRGLHLQTAPYMESKLVRCTRGSIFDVIIDLRKESTTYLQWLGIKLSADAFRMLYVPEGFAHGYLTLEDNTDVTYQVTQFYTPDAEKGFRWDDPTFKIEWPIQPVIISEKDKAHALYEHPKEKV